MYDWVSQMKSTFWLVISSLLLVSLACTVTIPVEQVKTVPPQTLNIKEAPSQTNAPVNTTITMGAGNLNISGGGSGLVEGAVTYNVPDWKPTVTRTDMDLTIAQGTSMNNLLPPNNVINQWILKFGQNPIGLTIQAGAYTGTMDMSGIPLTNLSISDGASHTKVSFKSTNPGKMQLFSYKTGASTIELEGLGNANFSEMTFDGGAGNYTLDFTGKLQQAASVQITSGVSDITVIVPNGTPCEVIVHGEMNSISPQGAWTINNKIYRLQGEGPGLIINVEMGVGSLKLINR
jgi:hypothetical protein